MTNVSLYAQLDVACRGYTVKEGHKLDIKEIILLGGGLFSCGDWSRYLGGTTKPAW